MSLPNTVASPITDSPATLEREIASSVIVDQYRTDMGYDVAPVFRDASHVGIYRCEKTGYRFFYPHGLAGDARFYQHLENRIPDYYDTNKWEHDLIAKRVVGGQRVLDIGCGRGSFLEKARLNGADVTGLELNDEAAAGARANGIQVFDEMLHDHAEHRPAAYDMVTAFQVLEHIDEPRTFLEDAKRVTKSGGLLVIAVPNDDGFIGIDQESALNSPPHHLGRWNGESLSALAGELGVDLVGIDVEPLNHVGWAQAQIERKYLPGGWRRKAWYRLGLSTVLSRYLTENARGIAGHTIIATYRLP